MRDNAIGLAVAAGEGPDPLVLAADGGPPLSIGLIGAGCSPDSNPNGVTTYVTVAAEGLRELGHRVTILDTQQPPGDRGGDVVGIGPGGESGRASRAADWLWYRVAPPGRIVDRASSRLAARVARAVSERGIEVLEMEEAFGHADRVRRAFRIPVSVRLHGPWFLNGPALGESDGPAFRDRVAREGRAIRRARAMTAPSLDVLERTRAHYGLALEDAEVIPNPTRPVPSSSRWRAGGCDPRTILFVGRFDRHKGGDLIVEAFARVVRRAPDARLWFAGPDRGLVDDEGRRWDLASLVEDRLPGAIASGRARLLGYVPHSGLDELRRAAAVTVVCSRYEVFGLTATEAMAMGAPVVASRVGGLAEVIRDGVDGLLHRPGDPDDLADRLVEILSDPARAAGLGARAAERCDREFRPVVVAARLAAHFRRARQRADAAAGAH